MVFKLRKYGSMGGGGGGAIRSPADFCFVIAIFSDSEVWCKTEAERNKLSNKITTQSLQLNLMEKIFYFYLVAYCKQLYLNCPVYT